jgi:UDP-N-acetylmuramoyl-L-alanyl-D-glutamate--2,6-diaminopimelate ligase
MAQGGDAVIVCGKGHEQSMCFGTVEVPWDDRTALRAALAERLKLPGPEMPWLPSV